MGNDTSSNLEIYTDVVVTRIEASPTVYINNPLVTLSKTNGEEIHSKFYVDTSKGIYAVDHIYLALMAGLFSGRPLVVQTTEILTNGYRNITNCIISSGKSSQ
ncbi:hypothetical protein LFL97_38775 (plasmid) [Burkholderia sp. JSH-S8]|nr:hypothetical protein LFL97_38775 [Burkholderia sp. JSH-S8]